MADIVERLMTQARVGLMGVPADFDIVSYRQAADTITALRAERDAAYRKGAEDMRERAAAYHDGLEDYHLEAHRFVASSHHSILELAHHAAAAAIRKLEAKP